MSGMKSNPHFAEHLIGSPDERSVPVMLAAIAYEQRTANLLNLYMHVDRQGDMPDEAGELFNDIANRLGLRDSDE